MKRELTRVLTAVTVLGIALAAVAQQDDTAKQRWQQRREAQNKAIQAIQADGVKLRAAFEEAGKALPNPERWSSMSDEERNKIREAARVRWDQEQKILADLEQQIAVMKGPRQLKIEQDEEMRELAEIRDLATQEKASKAANRLQGLIDRRQAKHNQTIQQIGLQP